jgi:hypothetical protein
MDCFASLAMTLMERRLNPIFKAPLPDDQEMQ